MAEAFDSVYFSGQGPVFIGGRDASGDPAGLAFVGDVSEVSMTANIDRTDIPENVTGNRNTAASFKGSTVYDLSITFRSAKAEHLARAVGGSVVVKAAGAATDEAKKGYHDKFTFVDNVKISTVVVTGAGGTPTYVADTDYVVHGDEGAIEVLSTGSIGDGDDLLIDYAYAAQKKVTADPSDLDLVIVCPAINRADSNRRGRLKIHKVNLDPGALSAILDGDDVATMQVSGKALFDDLQPDGDRIFSWDIESAA